MERPIALDRDADPAPGFRVVIPGRVVLRRTVVPHCNRVVAPLEPALKLRIGVVREEKFQQRFALGFVHADDVLGKRSLTKISLRPVSG